MSEPDPEDTGGNTEMFRAFVDRRPEPAPPRTGMSSSSFRLLTLLGGLALLAVVVVLLFR